MVTIKSKSELEKMQLAGRVTYGALKAVKAAVRPGVTTKELDEIADTYIRSQGCTPSFKGYGGFPGSVCASVNDVVIHGFPSDYVLKEGDIISIDVGACCQGYHGDACRTFGVGKISREAEQLIAVTRESFFKGLEFAKDGYRISDISGAVQDYAEEHGCSVLRDYCGHGIGVNLHEDPEVPNYRSRMRGIRLKPGMTICIEPMICQGDYAYYVEDDDWTVRTCDGKLAAHYENTVLVTNGEPVLLTMPEGVEV